MKRRNIGFFFFLILLLFMRNVGLAKSQEWNVLLITIDTLRYDRVSFYSDKYVKTPNIDSLARRSIVFTNAYSHAPVTLPSHTNIFTGTTPLFHGISDNPGFRVEDRFFTISEYYKEKGYATGAFVGAFPVDSRYGLDQGFDIYDDNYGTHKLYEWVFVQRTADKVVDPALEWISRQSGPWFSWVHIFDPHDPYQPPEKYAALYPKDLYSGEVAFADEQLGRIFNYLTHTGKMSNTLIILTSDHGEGLGERGEYTHCYFAYNNTIHIPLILHVPGHDHQIVAENICHADIFPTLHDLWGDKIPKYMQGETLLPIMAGSPRRNPKIYFESLTPHLSTGWAPLRGYIENNIKFIDLPIREVYDLEKDPGEENNLAAASDISFFRSTLSSLQKSLSGKSMIQGKDQTSQEITRRLRSLGYISESDATPKKRYTEKDDLKVLRPYQVRMQEAVDIYKSGKVDEAVTIFKGVITDRPDFIVAYHLLATIYYNQQDFGTAVKILERGLADNPGNISLMANLGIFKVANKQFNEAIAILEDIIKDKKYSSEYFNYLGVAYQEKGDLKKAQHYYLEALKLDGNYAVIHSNLGSLNLKLYLQTRDEKYFHTAVSYFDTALSFDPTLVAAQNGKSAAFRFHEKIEELKQLSDSFPGTSTDIGKGNM